MIKTEQKEQIFDDFLRWIEGIEEDDPLPYEMKYIYFILDFSNCDIILSYSASETKFKIFDFGPYCPLEAQYFFSATLKVLSKQIFDKKITSKFEVKNMFKFISKACQTKLNFLKDKSIFFGMRFKLVE